MLYNRVMANSKTPPAPKEPPFSFAFHVARTAPSPKGHEARQAYACRADWRVRPDWEREPEEYPEDETEE